MPRSKKTPEQLDRKAHEDMINSMMTMYMQASENGYECTYVRMYVLT